MAKRNYVSLTMLPLEDMANYFEKITGFSKKSQAAEDTKKVGTIDAAKIAVAAMDEQGNLVDDRNTVQNALELGGVAASEYITKDNSSSLLADTHNVSVITAEEIKSIRDELYQMRGELVKAGVVKDTALYNGFQDPFRAESVKYIDTEITRIALADGRSTISDITVLDSTDFEVGEYIVIKSGTKKFVEMIQEKQGDRLILNASISGPLDEFTGIYKTLGAYDNGSFLFGEQVGSSVSPVEKQIILKDGKVRKKVRELYRPNTGFATTITVPNSMGGMLKKIDVSLAATGNPGVLKAMIFEKTLEGFTKLGESDSILSAQATMTLRDIQIPFNTEIVLGAGKDYIVTLVSTFGDDSNKWYIGGFDEPCLDIVHKDCYEYADGVLTVAEDLADMYIALSTSEVLSNALTFYKKGVYSCTNQMSNLNTASRVRVELKINREGRFKVIDNPVTLLPGPANTLELTNTDSKSYGSAGIFQTGGMIAIGNQIAKVGANRVSNTSFALDALTYAPGGVDVYRIGYKVVVKAAKKVVDTTNAVKPIKTEYSTVIELPLVAVIPGKENGKETISSDRLIFEGELKVDAVSGYKLLDFNEIVTQIVWSNDGVTTQEIQTHNELAGRILDVTVSTDRAYNK
jgi:hypothetical protein